MKKKTLVFAIVFALVMTPIGVLLGAAPALAPAPYPQPVDNDDGTVEPTPSVPIGRVFAWYLLGGTRSNDGAVYPDGPNPLTIPRELAQQGLRRWAATNLAPSLEYAKPDAVLLHNPFGAPAGLAMAFHERELARDMGYLNLANGSDVIRAVSDIRAYGGTDEVWFYVGTADAPEFDELTYNEYLYSVQPMITANVGIVLDSAGDDGRDSNAWKYARTLEPWVPVGYEPRPHVDGPWDDTDFPCFATIAWENPDDLNSNGFFRSDPKQFEGIGYMASDDDIQGEIVIMLARGPNQDQVAARLLSRGYSVAMSGWEMVRYQVTADDLKAMAVALQANETGETGETRR